MKFGSIYYIMSFSARTTNVCIYTCSTRGRMEAAGIWWLLCENTLLPKQTKNGAPLLSLYYRQESLCIFGGLLLSKNEAQARRRRRSFQGIRGQPCVKDTVVVISDLYIRFRNHLLLPDVSELSFFLEERKIIHGSNF